MVLPDPSPVGLAAGRGRWGQSMLPSVGQSVREGRPVPDSQEKGKSGGGHSGISLHSCFLGPDMGQARERAAGQSQGLLPEREGEQ